jgi:putative FmdB family regulatory protein
MPKYEYRCKKCLTKFEMSGTFEVMLAIKPLCPNCRSENVSKLISVPSIHFKGNGFYKTDNNAIGEEE